MLEEIRELGRRLDVVRSEIWELKELNKKFAGGDVVCC